MILVGAGPQFHEVHALVHALGLAKSVLMLGNIEHSELVRSGLFGIADVFVTASETENQPMAILEAQANGIPCVGLSEKGIPDLIKDGINGFVVPNHDPAAFSRAVARILADDGLRSSLRAGALREIKITVTDATHLTATVTVAATAAVGATSVAVTTGAEVVSGTFTVTGGTPVLSTVAPSSGQQGHTLTVQITGQYTHFGASSAVSFGNSGVTAGTVTVTDATHLTATVTVAATAAVGATSVTVTTGTEAASATFTVTAGTPVLTTIAPSSGQQGQTLTVQITGQYTHFGASSAVSFGTSGVTAGTVTVTDATHLTATVTDRAERACGRNQRDGDDRH